MILNKVAESELITIDLSAFLPNETPLLFDLKPFLFRELILKEKDFRIALQNHDWKAYSSQTVLVFCSADAIIPVWAYMLVASYLQPITTNIHFDTPASWKQKMLIEKMRQQNFTGYIDKRVVIKGCGDEHIDSAAYFEITLQLLPIVKSIMYGEPCSTVPIYKRK
ncbi:MAG: DUF2480 family protein [Bacteroidetes bacterium]|nr:DUF2480 family protein [Bacteroidota bacterium]